MSFAALGLTPALLRAVERLGYTTPTTIQSAAIPAALGGRDILAEAPTGSGKTLAFALPLLQRIATAPQTDRRDIAALVLVPTRELATQVAEVIARLARGGARPVKVLALIGGVSINPQLMALRGGAEVLVATPGRLLDLVEHKAARLARTGFVVFDEADRLLDAGFADEVSRIVEQLPGERQTLLFSATFPAIVKTLGAAVLKDPLRLDRPTGTQHVPAIEQRVIVVDPPRRTALLHQLLAQHAGAQALVFVATRHASETVAAKLQRLGRSAAAWHGELSQGARARILADFKRGALQVVVATDVAARGIDITGLPVVVNYDLPRAADDYPHRIGRTGRAGATGHAISFVSAASEAHFRLIEQRLGRRLPRETVAGFEPTETATENAATGGIKGRRPSKKDKLRAAAAGGD